MRITALEPQQHDPDRVAVHVDGAFRCGLALDIVLEAALRVGDPVDEPTLIALEARDLRWRAREAALRLLAYRARTAAELRRRLLRKDFPPDVAREVVADFLDRGYLDDGAFADAFIRDRVRSRPRSKRRLVQELRARGVDEAVARTAVDEVVDSGAEIALARDAAGAWVRRNPSATARLDDADARTIARRRLHGFLARRGFDGAVIRQVAREFLTGGED